MKEFFTRHDVQLHKPTITNWPVGTAVHQAVSVILSPLVHIRLMKTFEITSKHWSYLVLSENLMRITLVESGASCQLPKTVPRYHFVWPQTFNQSYFSAVFWSKSLNNSIKHDDDLLCTRTRQLQPFWLRSDIVWRLYTVPKIGWRLCVSEVMR